MTTILYLPLTTPYLSIVNYDIIILWLLRSVVFHYTPSLVYNNMYTTGAVNIYQIIQMC